MNNIKGLSDKKRAEIAAITEGESKLVSLNEIASLVQRINSHMDDADGDVLSFYSGHKTSIIHMKPIPYLTEFIDFGIRIRDCDKFPYEFTSSIGGVTFLAIMSVSEVVDLKTTIPEQWEYIQSKVQVEAV
ncbi:hypothetical protein [Sporosarcina sp. FSL K6-5500]|uniref:hypothetical protein n=1 Tax=Sporosarcina sp. FSL K6-5500 TaxID=2921558 RepID=UPI0030FD18EE